MTQGGGESLLFSQMKKQGKTVTKGGMRSSLSPTPNKSGENRQQASVLMSVSCLPVPTGAL